MTDHRKGSASLESILFTDELELRSSRAPDYEKENQALVALTQALADSPQNILQQLSDTILKELNCGSSGVSLLTPEDGGKRFFWPAISGEWKSYIGGGTPRDFGPCGTVLDLGKPLLLKHVEKVFTYFAPITPLVEEALLVPIYLADKAAGTVWAVAHDAKRKFDAEDKRQLVSFARFASAACQALASLESNKWFGAIVESSEDAIVSKDLNGIVRSWNTGAKNMFGYAPEEIIGRPITLIIPPELHSEEQTILERLRAGQRIEHYETVRVTKNGSRINISLTISPVRDSLGRVIGASKIARDITLRNRAEQALRESELSARLLQVQDEERRRIARELHDGVGQLLSAVGMNISVVLQRREKLSPEVAERVAESGALIQHISKDIRTVSYLLHPPMLDEMGLRSALRWYVDGFAERSRIDAKLEIEGDVNRLPQEHELCLFRIAQECLTNVHRHSKGTSARVKLSKRAGEIVLKVQDNGRGISPEIQAALASGKTVGVGFRGIQERLRNLDGKIEIRSSAKGTIVTATLPSKETTLSASGPGFYDSLSSADVSVKPRSKTNAATAEIRQRKRSQRA